MSTDNDNQLIERAQSGDRAAFEELLRRHYDTIYRFAIKWGGNADIAEDIAQDVCIKLVRAIETFDFRAKFTSWLYRLVVHAAIDHQRSNARHQGVDAGESEAATEGVVDATAESELYARQVMDEIRTLPENEKTALLLVMGEGISHKEASRTMECKESTVSWYIHEARKKLDDKFGQERKRG